MTNYNFVLFYYEDGSKKPISYFNDSFENVFFSDLRKNINKDKPSLENKELFVDVLGLGTYLLS